MNGIPEYKTDLARTLRQRQTPSEARLWTAVRNHQVYGLGFRRQRPIGRYIADFCCESAKLIVEVDGDYHLAPEQRENDRERAAHFTGRGYAVLRVTADEVMGDLPGVLEKIREASVRVALVRPHPPSPSPVPGEGESKRILPLPLAEAAYNIRLPLSRNGGGGRGVGANQRNDEAEKVGANSLHDKSEAPR